MAAKKTPMKKPVTDSEDHDVDPDTEDTDSPEADPEDENKRINAIVTNRVKREMKAVNQQLVQLQELIKGLSSPGKKATDEDEDPDTDEDIPAAKKASEVDPKLSKKFSRMEKELAEQKARADKAEREKAEESERGKRNEMRNAFQSALGEYGVADPLLMEAALDRLEKTGQMFRDEDGRVKFKGQDKYGIETNYDPKIGLKTWVQTEGKSYVPAVDAGGSGTGASRSGQSGNSGTMTKGQYTKLTDFEKAAMELERASQGLPPLDA